MKITTFNPQIITKDAENIAKLFEELGFEKRHNPKGIGELDVTGIRMKNADGFYLDISQPDMQMPQDLTAIRMNQEKTIVYGDENPIRTVGTVWLNSHKRFLIN